MRRRLADGLGSVLLFARNIRDDHQAARLTASLRAENPAVNIAIDEEGGDVTRLDAESGSIYPGCLALGCVDDVALTEQVARSLGRRLSAAGFTLNHAPVADVNSNPDNPVIGVRSFGGDVDLVARHVAAWVRGLQSEGVSACVKHFPGHGDTSVDSHFAMPSVEMTEDQIIAEALPPFRAALAAGSRAVMLGHLMVPALDPDTPASVSSRIVRQLLRAELGFDGLAVTDGLAMRAITTRYGVEHAGVLALASGVDLVCLGQTSGDEPVERMQRAVVEAVIHGDLAEERLFEAAERVQRFSRSDEDVKSSSSTMVAPNIGLIAARKALQVTVRDQDCLPLRADPHVVAFTAYGVDSPGTAAETSLGLRLKEVLPRSTMTVISEYTPLDEILAAAVGRPLVLSVRSAHRHSWMRRVLDQLLLHRPDALVAEMGMPGTGPHGAAYLVSHGASKACAIAVAEALTSHGVTANHNPRDQMG